MNFETLKLFVEVVENGSLTKASIRLSALPSSLSRKISALERECGGRLLRRTGRGVTLTELGEQVVPRAKELIDGLQRLSHDIHANANVPMGEVRLGLLASVAHGIVPRLFQELRANCPKVRLSVFGGSNGRLDEWLAEGYVDLAVMYRYSKIDDTEEKSLGIVDTYLIAPRGDALTAAGTVEFRQLHDLPIILPGPPNGLRVVLDQLAKTHGINLNVVMEANSLPIQLSVVATGGVYAPLTGYAAAAGMKAGHLQAAKIINPTIERVITLGLSPRRTTLATREVARVICSIVGELASEMGLRRVEGR